VTVQVTTCRGAGAYCGGPRPTTDCTVPFYFVVASETTSEAEDVVEAADAGRDQRTDAERSRRTAEQSQLSEERSLRASFFGLLLVGQGRLASAGQATAKGARHKAAEIFRQVGGLSFVIIGIGIDK